MARAWQESLSNHYRADLVEQAESERANAAGHPQDLIRHLTVLNVARRVKKNIQEES
jgi:hypothetical protein